MTLEQVNAMPEGEAMRVLRSCCGATRWAHELAAGRPYASPEELLDRADEIWRGLRPEDWLEAFAHHPPIGRLVAARSGGADSTSAAWSAEEQARASTADAPARAALAAANRAYEERFGYIFLVCASGRSAQDILAAAEARMHNTPEQELLVAAEEQRQITALRLRKLLGMPQPSTR